MTRFNGKARLVQIASADARLDFENQGWMSALNATAIFAFWEDLMPGIFDGAEG